MIIDNISILKSNKINVKAKYKLISFEKKSVEIQTFNSLVNLEKNLVSFVFFIKKKRPDYDILKKEEGKLFDIFDFDYALGFFSGCSHFSFRVTFKEYKSGLKAAKFSLLLNQFCLKLERFIEIVNEILINNFCIDFYEDFFGDYLVDFDLKIHFLVILRTYSKVNTTTKFFIVPKGCFLGHLREYIWFSLFTDSLFLYTVSTYYKGFKRYLGVIFLLLIFYVYKLIHFNYLN